MKSSNLNSKLSVYGRGDLLVNNTDLYLKMPLKRRPKLHYAGYNIRENPKDEFFVLDFWCLNLFLYNGEVIQDGLEMPVGFGYLGISEPFSNVEYLYHDKRCQSYCVIFEFEHSDQEATELMHRMQDLRLNYEPISRQFDEIVLLMQRNVFRAEIKLWDLLWQLCENNPVKLSKETFSPAVRKCMKYVEENLSKKLSASLIAKQSGYSHIHLNRLFKSSLGMNISTYIKQRKVQHAEYLLRNTGLTVKEVAYECGITDVQQFNKIIRKYYDLSPSKLRES